MELTARQQRFVEEYLVDLNGTAAAQRAGYGQNSASSAAYRLLNLPHVAKAVKEAMRLRSLNLSVSQADVLEQLRNIAMGEASDASGSALKVSNKLRALELLGKHLGMFEGSAGKEQERICILEDVG